MNNKKFKHISTKLCTIIIAMFTVVIALITTTTILSPKSHNDEIMTDRAISSAKVLKTSVETEQKRLNTLLSNLITQQINSENAETLWTNFSDGTEYLSIYSGNDLVWSADNYIELADVNGITTVNNKLILQTTASTKEYTIVVGMDLSSETFLDNIKDETGAEVTLFLDNIRYGTTVINNGQRATGTSMDTHVANEVLKNRNTYTAQTDIMGQNHYVCYTPITDVHNNVIGAYFAGFSSAESDKSFTNVVVNSIITAVISLVIITAVIIYLVRRMVSKPISIVNEMSDNMSNGNLNAKETAYTFANDEIGAFADNLSNTKHKLNSIITDMTNILTAMADGDFTRQPNTEYFGDFTTVKNDFKKIETTLGQLISNINQSSSEVDVGALQMSNASQLLASGSIEQASAIEELTSTIEDFATQTKHCADNANTVHNLSFKSAEKMQLQETDINNLISAMADIKDKSEHIKSIIKTIDDIAFQIHILSLNATIESARAGESGKGFAVVASEVGNLANKSATAVQEIENLVNQALESVDNGTNTVTHTVNTITDVANISQEINALIDEIAVDINKEQEQINQITQGISQISEVVQQNSATAEETAASSEELSGQVSVLQQTIQKLKV